MNATSLVCLTLIALFGEPERPVEFDTQVVSLLTKCGCNAGACHGAAAGRGGLRLSLLGADADVDYQSIARQFEGRRVNVLQPQKSLIIRKPTEELDHSGGQALSDPARRVLERWIAEGAHRTQSSKLVQLRIDVQSPFTKTGKPIEVRVTAVFEDRRQINVTDWTVFTAADPSAIDVRNHRFVAHRPGRHIVIARYLSQVVPITIIVPFADNGSPIAPMPENNFIDRHITKTLSQLNLAASAAATDQQWLRRTTLVLTGQLPNRQQLQLLEAELSPAKRAAIVDELLSSRQFTDYWTFRIAKLLRLHSLANEPQAHEVYGRWIREQVESDAGWNEIACQLILGTGDSHSNGAANFARMVADARSQADFVGQSMAAIQLGCANCHNHPLDRWTQDDYHGLAAIFAPLERLQVVRFGASGEVTNPRTHGPAVPKIPGAKYLNDREDHRQQVFNWLVDEDEKLLSRAMVNRLWQSMFGIGLVEPVDDMRNTNPASHPELLNELATDFAKHGYKIRHTLKTIALSATFARSSVASSVYATTEQFYAQASYVRLSPEVLYDAVANVTNNLEGSDQSPQSVSRRSAILSLDPLQPFDGLDQLGRCRRVEGCVNATATQVGLATQLHLLNGSTLNAQISDREGALHKLIDLSRTNSEIVSHFYRAALSRDPTNDELKDWVQQVEANPSERRKVLEDFVWALLNCREFTHNH